ncbi:hypothetical protein OTK49_00855 [Vibrio coralliirubri]|uniref:hypothetical protein n=1 Tax=Vibrio coralliirubri TaxID=1516159 RepID=UPI002283B303|nr:hypothetical protein [Vibrio coralliirubri]MCY9861080.1 hypothetical protein [Vibrio coralliirubri]
MANWKLTPTHIGGNVFGITPEWTSGGGCYRVKRFSTQFPFFGYGGEEVSDAVIQLLRWSSKMPPAKDMSVLLNLDGRLVHLFSAQPFVVEFFRRLWLRHPLSDQFHYVDVERLAKYEFHPAQSMTEQMAITQMFVSASEELAARVRASSGNAALKVFKLCKKNRKATGGLDAVIEPNSLVNLSLWKMREFLKTELPLITVTRIENYSIDELSHTKKSARSESLIKIKSMNKERSKLHLTSEDAEFLADTKKVVDAEREVKFSLGKILQRTVGHEHEFAIYSYGAYCLLEVSSIDTDQVSYFPMRDLHSAKKMTRLVQSSGSPLDKYLCFKISVEIDLRESASVAVANDAMLDFFNDHWAGTSMSFCSYSSSAPLVDGVDALLMVERVCFSSHQAGVRSNAGSSLFA